MDETSPAGQAPVPVASTAIAATPAGAGAIVASAPRAARSRSFAFGDPETVLDRRELLGMAQSWWNGRFYEPPLPMLALARTRQMSPHHSSAIKYKVNQLARHFVPSRWLDRRNFGDFALNFLAMGNGYLQRTDNLAGGPLSLRNSPAVWTRRVKGDDYCWAPNWQMIEPFAPGSVFHLWEPDLEQEMYGIPEWLSALQSGLLNGQATVFRRRYYSNGAHAGFILYVGEDKFAEADADALEEALDNAKGPGNFKNLMLHIPGGREKGVQVIPIGEATAKDEFLGIKNTTRDDVLAAHRVPPVLIGVVPQVTGGFGAPGQAADVFHFAEIEPVMLRMLEINDWLGRQAVTFREYAPLSQVLGGAAPAGGR